MIVHVFAHAYMSYIVHFCVYIFACFCSFTYVCTCFSIQISLCMYVYVHVRLYSCDRFLVPLHIAHRNHSCNYILLEQRGHVNPNDIRHVKLRRCSHTKITSVMQCAL